MDTKTSLDEVMDQLERPSEDKCLCPYSKCGWKGEKLHEHFKNDHPECIKDTNTFQLNLKDVVNVFWILNDGRKRFWLKLRHHGPICSDIEVIT